MKPAAFKYIRVDTVEAVLAVLAEHGGDAKVLAGGQSLVPMLNFRIAAPAVLVDINPVAELDYIRAG
ncbi:MAG: FAD binding domain-containing protein, partial [Nitrospinota bacterium]|nr:FAD binding domain-containing protein [Nitrospinota bacterium]